MTVVVAVIVTYRRPELLSLCGEAVLRQTRPPDRVLVINNGPPGTVAGVVTGADVIETDENLGPAGGYALGITRALDAGATHVWTVDDDCIPDLDCLSTLLDAGEGESPGIRIPLQRTADGRQGSPPSWNGTLFDASVLRAVGGPRPEWFFWKEDIDLINRARDEGFGVRQVPAATVDHRTSRQGAIAPRDWRLYYETRNALTYRTRVRRRTWKDVPIAWRNALATAWTITLREPDKAASLVLWGRGVLDHLRHRMGRRVDPS